MGGDGGDARAQRSVKEEVEVGERDGTGWGRYGERK